MKKKLSRKQARRARQREAEDGWSETEESGTHPVQTGPFQDPNPQPNANGQKTGFVNSVSIQVMNVFREADKALTIWKREGRPRIPAELDGHTIDFLYDMGASISCLKWDTFNKFFPGRQLTFKSEDSCVAAGHKSLNYKGSTKFQVACRGKKTTHEFMVCERINDNILGIDLARVLELSYNAKNREIYAVTKIPNSLLMHQETNFPAQSVMAVTLKVPGKLEPGCLHVATIIHPES